MKLRYSPTSPYVRKVTVTAIETGLIDIEIRSTHRVHEYASSAIVRARKPEVSA